MDRGFNGESADVGATQHWQAQRGKERDNFKSNTLETRLKTMASQFKLVLLGETAVGKSSIALRFCRDQFQEYRYARVVFCGFVRCEKAPD